MKIYIAGKITGDPIYKARFAEAEEAIKEYYKDRDPVVLNPAILPEGLTDQDYMQITMAMLNAADLAVFLPNSHDSAGAMIEWSWCKKIGKPYKYFDPIIFRDIMTEKEQ